MGRILTGGSDWAIAAAGAGGGKACRATNVARAFPRLAESRQARKTSSRAGAVYASQDREKLRRHEGSQANLHKRLAIRYAVEGDLRFISHHDTLRLFERALARADIPVRFSAGFNPRARLSIVLPRPVGVASTDELLLIELDQDLAPETAQARLSAQMPAGLTIRRVQPLDCGERPRPSEATYELTLTAEGSADLSTLVEKFLAQPGVLVQRVKPGDARGKSVDVRAYVVSMQARPGTLRWSQAVGQEGSVRIGELLAALGLDPAQHLHRVRRVAVRYDGLPAD
ncbi:MAG: hypothetical protein DCC66_01260 [Planctomycetota bacterium]|nr:MAG: hypothetical protein DCC66_01260 [Planctomycetota bacterium]